jgi:hypothetical protein
MTYSRSLIVGSVLLWSCTTSPSSLLDPEPIDPRVLDQGRLCKIQDSLLNVAGAFPTIDAEFSILATLLPGGFGGLSTEGMFLVFPTREPSTRQVAESLDLCPGRRLSFLASVRTAIIRPGQFDWLQLSIWRTRLVSAPHIQIATADLDENTNRLTIGLHFETERRDVLTALPQLRIPPEAVVITVSPPPPP